MWRRRGASDASWWSSAAPPVPTSCPQVESIYWWEKKVESANETLVLFKTTADRYAALETTLRQLHPYEVPEIIAVKVEQGSPDYLRWVSENCAA